MKLAIIASAVLILAVACGPSESEVTEQLNSQRDWVTDTVQESIIRQNDQVQTLLDNQAARIQTMLDADVERDQKLLDSYYESVDSDLAEVYNERAATNEELTKLYEDLLEMYYDQVRLVQAICEVDYWQNVHQSMLWVTLDHLTGGESTLEEAQAYTELGIAVPEDYATTISGICDVADEGNWKIADGIMRITADVRSR